MKKNILAENMRRFRTKNLNEAIVSDTFYIYFENLELSNTLTFNLKLPQVTTLKDPIDTVYDGEEPITDMIVYELLGYDRNVKQSNDYEHLNLDDWMALQDDWYTVLKELAVKAGLTVSGGDDDDDDDDDDDYDDWSDDEDDDDDEDKRFSQNQVSTTFRLRNNKVVDITFIKGVSNQSSYSDTMEAIYKCTVRGAKSAVNQTMN